MIKAFLLSPPAAAAAIGLALALAATVGSVASHARPVEAHGDAQGAARRELHRGEVHSLRDIERRVLPMMAGAQYLGPEYDEAAMAYRLKFIRAGDRAGHVMFVDVDARSGAIIGQSQ